MPPELPIARQITVNRDGSFHLEYTTTDEDGTETHHRVPLNGTLDHLTPARPATEYFMDIDDENDLRDLAYTANFYNDRLTIDPADANIPNTTIHTSDCSGEWKWLYSNEEQLREIVRETVKELLEQEGFIIGKIPNQPSDLPIGE